MQRAVDGDDVTLGKHILQLFDTAAANLLLNFGVKRLVVVVKELLALKWFKTTQDTLANTANGNGSDDLTLQVEFVLRDGGNIPLATGNLLVSWDKVANQSEDGHDDMLGDGNDIAASNLGDGDTTVGLVGSIEIDVVRSNTGSDGELQVLSLCQAFGGEITRVEAVSVG